ncbi:MAG TPA: LytR C-terminal domain-containing protein [Cellulomonas sp.]
MSKGSYPYPEDEFDAAPAQDTPIGVHRAPRSWWSRWWPFVTVLVVVPALTVGFVLWASSWDGDLTLPGASTAQDEETTATDPATDAATDTATDPAAEAPATEETPATEEAPAVVEPDLATAVSVLNAARVSGLAAGVASDLEDAGFTAVTTGNTTASGRTTTTVYYASADLQVTAQKVADTLGITTVTESADDAGDAITVLLLSDFTG